MVFGTRRDQIYFFVATLMLIGLVIRMIGNQPPGLANSLAGPWCVGLLRSKKYISLSTAEAEYVAAASGCTQLLWMRQTLRDYGVDNDKVPLLCDNESAIKIAYNPVQHSRTKHIEIRNHFIRDHVARGDIELQYVPTKDQLADIFTKPLDEVRFCYLRNELNIIDSRVI